MIDASLERSTTYQDIADHIRQRLMNGQLVAGQRLPSREALVERYAVRDRTVVHALHQLWDEGWIVARRPAGWVVREQRLITREARPRLSRAERAAGRGAVATDLHHVDLVPEVTTAVWFEPADEQLAAVLDVDPGTPVCVRDRVVCARRPEDSAEAGEPVQLATSYIPRSVSIGTAVETASSGPGGVAALLEETGHPLTHFTERVSVGRADDHEARELRIRAGDPTIRLRRCAWSGGRVIEVDDAVIAGTRWELVYELPSE